MHQHLQVHHKLNKNSPILLIPGPLCGPPVHPCRRLPPSPRYFIAAASPTFVLQQTFSAMSSATRQKSVSSPDLSPVPPAAHARKTRKYLRWPLPTGKPLVAYIAAVFLLLVPVFLLEAPVLRHSHGDLLFPADNAFLNICVGRTLAFYQVWGLSKYAFQSASSSLLYPIVLAPIFFIAGEHLLIPLLVNFLAAAWFLLAVQRSLIRHGFPPLQQLFALLSAIVLTMLPLLVVSGMEYTLQLLFVFLFLEALTEGTNYRRIYIYGLLAVATRYEDIIIIGLACILLGIQKGWKPALRIFAVSISPMILFGFLSIAKHNYFLPNALLIGSYPTYALVLAAIAIAAACMLLLRFNRLSPSQRTTFLPRLALGLLVLLILPFTARNLGELGHFQRDCIRLYDQQYPMAGFVHLYYYKRPVGINLPGAVSYFSEGKKLDFTGAATSDVVRSKRGHYWSGNFADSLSRKDGIRVAIVADPWFSAQQLPDTWNKIASWNIPGNGPSPGAGRTVSFYAINKYDTTFLRRNLHAYQHLLPSGIAVRYY
jgi:hypothetical protein